MGKRELPVVLACRLLPWPYVLNLNMNAKSKGGASRGKCGVMASGDLPQTPGGWHCETSVRPHDNVACGCLQAFALVGCLVTGTLARRRRIEVEGLNNRLRQINGELMKRGTVEV